MLFKTICYNNLKTFDYSPIQHISAALYVAKKQLFAYGASEQLFDSNDI